MENEWHLKALGRAAGRAEFAGREAEISWKHPYDLPVDAKEILIHSVTGKIADSKEDLLFFYTKIDPRKNHFVLEASFEVTDTRLIPDYQTGYGIFVCDTDYSGAQYCGYRNSLALGQFRLKGGLQHGNGMRVTANCLSAHADRGESRILDPTRRFAHQPEEDSVHTGDINVFRLEKNDAGFAGSLNGEELLVRGHDFLLKQDPGAIFAGVMVSGKISVRIRIEDFRLSDGGVTSCPENEIVNDIPDYPFERELLSAHGGDYRAHVRHDLPEEIHVSPEGTPAAAGTADDPVDLQTALSSAGEGSRIILREGIYMPRLPYFVPGRGGTAEARGRVILDGSLIGEKLPLMILKGDHWSVSGLEFRKSPSCGIHICGSHNRIVRCKACENGDTGMLICAFPGSAKAEWPADNLVLNCDSFRNCDGARCNADGFGAKLSAGEGNRFEGCIACHNADDGFDLYTKVNIGRIGSVSLKNCIAFENGTPDGASRPRGIGFKLGGEFVACPHTVRDCLSYGNRIGFSANNNPAGTVERCISFDNTEKNYRLESGRKDVPSEWKVKGCFPMPRLPDKLQNRLRRILLPDERISAVKRRDAGGNLDWTKLRGQGKERPAAESGDSGIH